MDIKEEIALVSLMEENEKKGKGTFITEDSEILKSDSKEQLKIKKDNLSNSEISHVVLGKLKNYESKIKEINQNQKLQEDKINPKFNDEAKDVEKRNIEISTRDERIELKSNTEEYVDVLIDSLNKTIEDASATGSATSTQALNDIQLLDMLEEVDAEDLKVKANTYRDNPLVLKKLKEIGTKHDIHVNIPSKDNIMELPNELKETCQDFISNYNGTASNYSHGCLVAGGGNSTVEDTVKRVEHYLNGEIQVN